MSHKPSISTMSHSFALQTDDPAELLRVLTVDMMFHHLQISNTFQPSHLWSWIDRSQIYSIAYLDKSYESILNSWTMFKCTGHGAIELGRLMNVPEYLFYWNLGLESRRLSQTEVFLKMNVDEYLALVSFVTDKVMQRTTSLTVSPHVSEPQFFKLDAAPLYDPFAASIASAGLSPLALPPHAYTSSSPSPPKHINATKRSGTCWLNVKKSMKSVLRFW